jgi:hypothetical protein
MPVKIVETMVKAVSVGVSARMSVRMKASTEGHADDRERGGRKNDVLGLLAWKGSIP